MKNLRSGTYLKALVAFVAMASTGRAVLVENGLVLNLQADNIDGLNNNNAGMTDGQEVDTWVDVTVPLGHQTQDNATAAGAALYLTPTGPPTGTAALGTPNYVAATATGRPGLRFARPAANQGDALGVDGSVSGLSSGTLDFTVFVVADLDDVGAQRLLQIGQRSGANGRVVGFGNNGFRFNLGSKVFSQNLGPASPGAHMVTYSMDATAPIANASFRFDGVAGTGAVTDDAAFTSLNTMSFNQGYSVGVGQSGGGGSNVNDPIRGIVYAMLVYNRILDLNETAQVETFLYEKFIAVPEASSWAALSLAAAAYGVVWQVRRRSRR